MPMPVERNKDLTVCTKTDDVFAGLRGVAVEHRHFGAVEDWLPL